MLPIGEILLIGAFAFQLYLSPYTKVEELFNLQAIHDIINFGVYPDALSWYDHVEFPGAVPRTFIGATIIAGITKYMDFVATLMGGQSLVVDGNQIALQYVARAVLGVLNIVGVICLKRAVESITFKHKKSGSSGLIGTSFVLLLVTQFHFAFYGTRTLPNFIALPLVNYALSKLVKGEMSGLTWLAFTGVVFRVEILVFAGCIGFVSSAVFGQSLIVVNGFLLLVGTLVGAAVSTTVDSYFWGRTLLPELESFVFNVIHGQSANWGTEPYTAYISKYIPNLFKPPHVLVLALVGFLNDPAHDGQPTTVDEDTKAVVYHPARHSLRVLGLSCVLFVLVMSKQPHKEWRFIFYIVPVLTLLAGNGLAHLIWRRSFSVAHKVLLVIVAGSWILSALLSGFMGYASSFNYPGGHAVASLNSYIVLNNVESAVVHLDVPTCMTGFTRFTEIVGDSIQYDKSEDPQVLNEKWNSFDYLVSSVDMDNAPPLEVVVYDSTHWEKIETFPIFVGVNPAALMIEISRLVKDEKARSIFFKSVIQQAQNFEINAVTDLLRKAILLRDYIHIYKRTAQDVLPTYIRQQV